MIEDSWAANYAGFQLPTDDEPANWKFNSQFSSQPFPTEAIHLMLKREGISLPRSTIHRVLDRNYCLKKRSPYKRFHPHVPRPVPAKAGDLVQLDTIHLMIGEKDRIYVFVLIDVYSRWAYARCYSRMSSAITLRFVAEAQRCASFQFRMLQSDHGPEFGSWFVSQIKKNHRYTRIGKPNDNAHIDCTAHHKNTVNR